MASAVARFRREGEKAAWAVTWRRTCGISVGLARPGSGNSGSLARWPDAEDQFRAASIAAICCELPRGYAVAWRR